MQIQKNPRILRGMAWLGVGAAAVTVLLRCVTLPNLRDAETGLFAFNWVSVGLLLAVLAVLAVGGFTQRDYRLEVTSAWAIPLGSVLLISGGLLLLSYVWKCGLWLFWNEPLNAAAEAAGGISGLVAVLETLLGIAAGVALARLGLQLIAEGKSRRGMAGWSVLLPVLWMWFRLAGYEMSYSSIIRLDQSFFHFVMFVLEMVFLFKFARYVAGVGKVSVGSLQFYACATAAFALSGPLVRAVMYLLGDSEAYLATQLSGLVDGAVGLLAAAVSFALAAGRTDHPSEEEESAPSEEFPEILPDEDTPSVSSPSVDELVRDLLSD